MRLDDPLSFIIRAININIGIDIKTNESIPLNNRLIKTIKGYWPDTKKATKEEKPNAIATGTLVKMVIINVKIRAGTIIFLSP
jgi:hypothetical protein